VACGLELFKRLLIQITALILIDRFAVRVQPEGIQGAQYVLRGAGDLPWPVQVFHAYEPFTAVRTGVEKTADRRDK
jgi:hypothetical protein